MKPARTNAKGAARPKGRAGDDALSCAISTALREGSPINVSEIMAWQRHVIKDRSLSPLAVRVAIEMALSFDRTEQETIRSHKYFMDTFGAARNGIQKAINEISDAGYLIVIRDKNKGAANRYSLTLPLLESFTEEEHNSDDGSSEIVSSISEDSITTQDEMIVVDEMELDPLIDQSSTQDTNPIDYYKDVLPRYQSSFDKLRENYPPKDNEHIIVNAKDFFFILCEKGEDIEKIVDGAKRYHEWAREAGIVGTKQVLQMWQWLRDRGWEDPRITPEAPSQ